VVHKVKFRHLWLSLYVADLAGIRNLKKMVKAEFRAVKWLQAFNHLTWIAVRRAISAFVNLIWPTLIISFGRL
jgi:hypothetical protein